MGGRFVWLGSLDVWTVRWRSFVTLRIRRGVRIRVPARGDLWVASGAKCGNRGLWVMLVSAARRSGRNDRFGVRVFKATSCSCGSAGEMRGFFAFGSE